MAEPPMRVLRNQADIVKLFLEGERAAYDFFSNQGLLMDDKLYNCAKGQVKVSMPNLKEVPELKDEGGMVCSICREGYKSQPQKAFGVYTFSKRVNVEEFDHRPIKQPGYSTISHMNLVPFDCHQQAVKTARGREKWESAALHNANTRIESPESAPPRMRLSMDSARDAHASVAVFPLFSISVSLRRRVTRPGQPSSTASIRHKTK